MFEPPNLVAFLLRDFKPDWFIAGGWAIDLFLGKETRPHKDIEIAVFRKDQLAAQNYLKNWNLKKVVNAEFSDWKKGEFLEKPIHEIHCFNETGVKPFLEVLLNETNGKDWIFRRNGKITKPVSELYLTADNDIKFLRPEIVLLYKSKNPAAKDEQDFQKAAEYLDFESKKWLKDALSVCYSEHHWLEKL